MRYWKNLKEYTYEILQKNQDVIKRMVATIRRHRAHGNVGISVCIKPSTKKITQWAYGFGGQPILHCEPGEKFITVYFKVPNPFISRKEIAESIAESLLMYEESLE